ncbi:hypothetical protein FA15DRAFT_627243 [Coprinopsis marcescibilis]|uniref:Transmembrane protein n=1 Tax=Coprinopsis marcescibilis TaxID=230819 RepID=A0A5C3KTC1_COPMA|nr:hypothetical protein FA15DRAFT_627243 [Coprinopsis marcescibilis]
MGSRQRLTRWVAIDDDDPSITYTGSWLTTDVDFGPLNKYGPPHGGSQHYTTTSGTLSFPFRGSRVVIFGTSQQINTTSIVDPTWECAVDGTVYPNTPGFNGGYPMNMWPLCIIDLAFSEQHVLTVRAAAGDEGVFLIDLIQYRPDYELRDDLHPTVFIDSTDPAVKYSEGGWTAYMNETMLSMTEGSKVSVQFNGTKATWVGWIPEDHPLGSSSGTYSIDGQPPTQFSIPGLSLDANGTLYGQRVLETPSLSRGAHTLEVVYGKSAAPLVLDYLIINNGDIFVSPFQSPTNTTAGGPEPTPPNDNNASQTPIGAIVGGAVGGFSFIVALLFLLYFCFWRKRSSKPSTATSLTPQPSGFVSPNSTGAVQVSTPPTNPHTQPYSLQPYVTASNHTANYSTASVPTTANRVPMYVTSTRPNVLASSQTTSTWSPPSRNNITSYPDGLHEYQDTGQLSPPTSLTPLRLSTGDTSSDGRISYLSGDLSRLSNQVSMSLDGSDDPRLHK